MWWFWRSASRPIPSALPQTPFPARDAVAAALGLSSRDVRVITPFVGGGFGGKSSAGLQSVEAARLSKIVGKPVQVAWTRAEDCGSSGSPGAADHRRLVALQLGWAPPHWAGQGKRANADVLRWFQTIEDEELFGIVMTSGAHGRMRQLRFLRSQGRMRNENAPAGFSCLSHFPGLPGGQRVNCGLHVRVSSRVYGMNRLIRLFGVPPVGI